MKLIKKDNKKQVNLTKFLLTLATVVLIFPSLTWSYLLLGLFDKIIVSVNISSNFVFYFMILSSVTISIILNVLAYSIFLNIKSQSKFWITYGIVFILYIFFSIYIGIPLSNL